MSPIFTCKSVDDCDIVLSLHDVSVVKVCSPYRASILFRGYDDLQHYSFEPGGAKLLFETFIKYKEFEAAEQIKQLANLYSANK
jgi:hypothetical protein